MKRPGRKLRPTLESQQGLVVLGPVALMNTLVTYNPVTVGRDESLARVLRLMDEYEMHHVPVVDDDFRLLGIVSDTDVSRCLAADVDDVRSEWDEFGVLPTAGTIMTTDVASVEAELAPLVALETMIRRHVNSVPVVDHGRLRGIITSRDFLREFVQLAPRAARTPAAKAISPWRPTIGREASPEEALRQLEAHNARYLGVADGLQAVGVLSLRQLGRARRIELVGFDENDASLIGSCCDTVGDLLGSAAACIEPLRSLGDAAELLCERRADGLAVVEPSGRITGMLTISDLLNVLSLELARRA